MRRATLATTEPPSLPKNRSRPVGGRYRRFRARSRPAAERSAASVRGPRWSSRRLSRRHSENEPEPGATAPPRPRAGTRARTLLLPRPPTLAVRTARPCPKRRSRARRSGSGLRPSAWRSGQHGRWRALSRSGRCSTGMPEEAFPHPWAVLGWLDGSDAWTTRHALKDAPANALENMAINLAATPSAR